MMSSMNLQSACELLLRIEQEVDVNAMLYEDAHLWPLVRQYLWVTSIRGDVERFEKVSAKSVKAGQKSKQKTTLLDHFHHIVTSRKTHRNLKGTLRRARQFCTFSRMAPDICFLSQPIYYSEILNGRSYSRIIDPIYELLSPRFRCLKLEEAGGGESLLRHAYSCRLFDALPLKAEVDRDVLENIRRSGKILRDISRIAEIEESELMQGVSVRLQRAIKYRDTYAMLLKKFQPKLLFLASYYFPRFMGLNWAASMNGIPTIDIQHGKQGKFQGMYSHWTTIPEDGYALLPTWFWSWGKPSAENIMKWQVDRKVHRCVVGGYPWISRWNGKEFSSKQFKRPDAEKVILISTQAPVGGLDDFFPEMLVNAIQQSPVSWCWIIREHPNYKRGNSVIKKKLKNVDDGRYIMDAYNNVPLYTLLSVCDFHVTAYSSVCYEAEVFSVPTAIFSEVGRKMYSREIEDRCFTYCDSENGLIEAVLCFKVKRNKEKYIESDIHLVSSALQVVSQGSGLNLCLN